MGGSSEDGRDAVITVGSMPPTQPCALKSAAEGIRTQEEVLDLFNYADSVAVRLSGGRETSCILRHPEYIARSIQEDPRSCHLACSGNGQVAFETPHVLLRHPLPHLLSLTPRLLGDDQEEWRVHPGSYCC